MNAAQRREARRRISFVKHVEECADEVCPQCCKFATTDLLVRVARDSRLALESLEFVEKHQQTIPLEAWIDGAGV